MTRSASPHVLSLHHYPIKSCRGIDVASSHVEARGLAGDRRFMVVDAAGTFRSQRNDPSLAHVTVQVDSSRLTLTRAGADPLEVDLAQAARGTRITTSVWRHEGPAVDQGDQPAAWLTSLLGSPSRLVHMPDDVRRPVNPERAVSPDDVVGFADGYPVLLTSTASLAALQDKMDEHVPMDRFRANVVVEGAVAWAEDAWQEVLIGEVRFAVVADCTRCAITTTDQLTGERTREPLRTLGRVRKTNNGVTFGRYLVPIDTGKLRVGDEVNVLR